MERSPGAVTGIVAGTAAAAGTVALRPELAESSARAGSVGNREPAAPAEPEYLAGPPLFWRLLAANLLVVLGGAVVGTALTRQFVLSGSFTPLTHAMMVLAAIGLSAALTALILRLAFRPLRALRETVEATSSGERPLPATRVALSRYDDPDILAVAQAVNGLWDRLDVYVRLLEESNHRLEEQRRELAAKSEELERLATMVLAAQEDERRRIARELHDETMQSMAALIMGLERGLQAMPADVPHLRASHQTVARLRDVAVRMLDELRHLALDLRPAVLDDHGLVAAVRWLAQEQAVRSGLEIGVELQGGFAEGAKGAAGDPVDAGGDTPRLPPAIETALFRIVQEALANAIKHAGAQHAVVRLSRSAEVVVVEVEDDGVGLPADQASPPGHMGLFNMRERAVLLGGRCTFGPGAQGKGTRVRAELPIAVATAGAAGPDKAAAPTMRPTPAGDALLPLPAGPASI